MEGATTRVHTRRFLEAASATGVRPVPRNLLMQVLVVALSLIPYPMGVEVTGYPTLFHRAGSIHWLLQAPKFRLYRDRWYREAYPSIHW